MATVGARIQKITGTGGNYAYTILVDEVSTKAVVGQANASAAFDAAKADIVAAIGTLGNPPVEKITVSVTTS